MGLTALQARGEGLGAANATRYKTAEYRGATTAACFSDVTTEFASLVSGCGIYDLGFLARLTITGGDRVRWLNGMVTNNTRDLMVGSGVYAFLLNPQGHILGDLYAYNRGESFTVDTDRTQVEKILATFDHYIIMDDVEVTNLSEQVTALGIAGPKAHVVLKAAGLHVPEMRPLEIQAARWRNAECTLVQSHSKPHVAYEIWLEAGSVRSLWDGLLAVGASPAGCEVLEVQRIASGIPLYGVDIRERDLPQETEQARALNFNKGCYIGQEIVERIRSRGAVHRRFSGFLVDDAVQIKPGTKIIAGGKDVGEITSATSLQLAGEEKTVALGYIQREAGTPGREVSISANTARVIQLPVEDGGLAPEERPLEPRRA